jgi:1-acyl-sn-glycerol-3-phosphate acyltransferase
MRDAPGVPPAAAPPLGFLPPTARGVLSATLLGVNTLAWCSLLFAFALVKLLLPFRAVRARIDPILNGIAESWIACNSGWMGLVQRTRWDVAGIEGLRRGGWYMVNANHQSWVDILVLQHLLNRRIPLLKFFLKQQLIYVPVIGLAWWALDFPFMRRHSDAYLKAHPEKRFDDLEATRKACAKFSLVPTSVMNFAEGTRFTKAKHHNQHSPYRHLLKPKAGALALALHALGDRFRAFLDVTIVYPGGAPTFWQFLCGNVEAITVRVRELPIPKELGAGDYSTDTQFRKRVQGWLGGLWQEKDREIGALLGEREPAATNVPL